MEIFGGQNIFTGKGSTTLPNGEIHTGTWGIIDGNNILTGEGSITWTNGEIDTVLGGLVMVKIY